MRPGNLCTCGHPLVSKVITGGVLCMKTKTCRDCKCSLSKGMTRHSCEKCSAHLCEDCYRKATKVRTNPGRDFLRKLCVWQGGHAPSEAEPDVKAAGVCAGSFIAWMSPLNDFVVNPAAVAKIQSAIRNHGISAQDAISALPGELEKYGTAATDAFLRGGDKVGKDWSHIQSQFNRPDLASHAANATWEDGTVNRARGKCDMTTGERTHASIDNHLDGLIAAAQTPEFWQRTLGNAMESAVYAACIVAVQQILIHRDELINGDDERRKQLVHQILRTSGVSAMGALPTSIVFALIVALVPGVKVVLVPLGIVGLAGLGIRLISAVARHPSRQELQAIAALQNVLAGIKFNRSCDKFFLPAAVQKEACGR